MAEAPRYQRGPSSSAAAPRDAKRQRTQPFAAQTCMACDGPLAASTAPDANGLLLCGRCVKFNNNAKPRKPREKVVPPPTRKEALAEYFSARAAYGETGKKTWTSLWRGWGGVSGVLCISCCSRCYTLRGKNIRS